MSSHRKTTVDALIHSAAPDAAGFQCTWGHAALLHQPAPRTVEKALLLSGTVGLQRRGHFAERILLLLRAFRDMAVDFLPQGAEGMLTLGRGTQDDLWLSDPSVSKRHAVLQWEHGTYRLQDCGSTNGTLVNGQLIDGPVELQDGDTIGLGDVHFAFVSAPVLYLQLTALQPATASTRAISVTR